MSEINIRVNRTIIIPINRLPLMSSSDFTTIRDNIAYNSPGMVVQWNFLPEDTGIQESEVLTLSISGNPYGWYNNGNGMYSVQVPASATGFANDRVGTGWFTGKVDGVLAWASPILEFSASGFVTVGYTASGSLNKDAFQDELYHRIADHVLTRDWTKILLPIAERCLLQAARILRNKFDTTTNAGKVTVFEEDDTSEAWRKNIDTDPAAEPITGTGADS